MSNIKDTTENKSENEDSQDDDQSEDESSDQSTQSESYKSPIARRDDNTENTLPSNKKKRLISSTNSEISSNDGNLPEDLTRIPLRTVPPGSQRQSTPVTRNSCPGLLRDMLEKDTDCRAVVLKYDSTNSLSKTLRSRLARFIIDTEKKKFIKNLSSDELLSEFRIPTHKFKFFANEIHRTFPRESPATYYTPFRRYNNISINAGGKLWWHYDYAKNKMFKDGILANRGKKTNAPSENVTVPASSIDKMESLRTKLTPWAEVIQFWVDTFDARRNDLVQNRLSVREYIEKFVCLRETKALTLFEGDFFKLHPGAIDRLKNTWELATDHLVEKLSLVNIKDQADLELRAQLHSENSDFRAGLLLSLLHYLVPPRRPGRKRKVQEACDTDNPVPPRVLTIPERKESFFIHITDVVNLDVVLTTGKSHTSRLSLEHQPIPIIVGPFHNISACYIILENILYESPSILHAFESVIQICYAVNCEYPLNARSLWIFLQQAYLNIEEATDKPSVEATALIGEIHNIIKEVEEFEEFD